MVQGTFITRCVVFIWHIYRPQTNFAKVMFSQAGFPLGLENLEKWEGIFQSGKSQGILIRLEKSGKSQGKSHKILESQGISDKYYYF